MIVYVCDRYDCKCMTCLKNDSRKYIMKDTCGKSCNKCCNGSNKVTICIHYKENM